MSPDDIWECECGSQTYYVRLDGLLECSECETIMDERRAEPRDPRQEMRPN